VSSRPPHTSTPAGAPRGRGAETPDAGRVAARFVAPAWTEAALPPCAGRFLGRLGAPIDGALSRLFGSRWNPLHQTGTVSVLAFLVAALTGIYLFLFYKIAEPYESVTRIASAVPAGGFVRGLHRYAADLSLVAALLHLLRKLAQGHTWGPRRAAWWSGVLLVGATLLCGWTGLVMAWDQQGLAIASEGARLLDLLPLFSEPIGRTFAGGAPVPSSFFFMNLFLHVALPLGLAGLLWLHVSRLARPHLLPPRRLLLGWLGLLGAMALLAPPPLLPPADPLALPGRLRLDLLYAFWLPLARGAPPAVQLLAWLALFAALLAMPLVWRPLFWRRAGRPGAATIRPSVVDEGRCTGCEQCWEDCPYEAIAMVPRGTPSRLGDEVARVDPALCVSCGICAGSCAPMGVGPPGRDGRSQLVAMEELLLRRRPGPSDVVLIACRHGAGETPALQELEGVVPWASGCSGSVHTSVVEMLLRRGVGGVFLLTCPGRDCLFREGPRWLGERLFHGREAELQERVDRRRVRRGEAGGGTPGLAVAQVTAFRDQVRALATPRPEEAPQPDLECVDDEAVAAGAPLG
jgi:ferredoxin